MSTCTRTSPDEIKYTYTKKINIILHVITKNYGVFNFKYALYTLNTV